MGYFADAQYDVKSPIVGVADTSPEGGSDLFVFARKAKRRSNLPGGWRSTEYKFRTFSVGYFADAQYDVLFLYVILNDSEESHLVSEEYIFCGKPPSREIASLRSQRQYNGAMR